MIRIDLTARHGDRKFRYQFETDQRRVILAGPSGSGKTTLLKALVGVHPCVGEVEIDGRFLVDSSREIRIAPHERNVGWAPQDHDLFPHLNVEDNLTFGGADGFEQVIRGLELKDLLRRFPKNLSGGEKQRVALGRALLCRPKLLLLDEPFSALNDVLKQRVLAFIVSFCEQNDAHAILCAHDHAQLEMFSSERWMME